MASRERMRRSMETEGSPASILATRDWLDLSRRASCAWVSLRRVRRSRRPRLRMSFSSTRASSALESPSSSRTVPSFHPARSRRALLSFFMGLTPSYLASSYIFRRRLQSAIVRSGVLCVDHRIRIDSVHDPPVTPSIFDPQLVALGSDGGHRSRVGHAHLPAQLHKPQEVTRFHPGLGRERRRLDLASQPDQGFPGWVHRRKQYMSGLT